MNQKTKIIALLVAIGMIVAAVAAVLIFKPFGAEIGNFMSSPTPAPTATPTAAPTATPTPNPYGVTEEVYNLRENIKDNVKALYLTGNSAGLNRKMNKIINLAKETQVNAVVIDVKEDGVVNYKSNVPDVVKYGAWVNYYDPTPLIKKLHENGIYVIGRIVCFRDKVLPIKRNDLAIKSASGKLFKKGGFTWVNAYMKDAWDYNIAIADEAVKKGFDEIQFDYVRFPEGRKSEFDFGKNPPPKYKAISGFLAEAKKKIKAVPVSADIFAIVIESKLDGNAIGQVIEEVGKDIDYISPMMYPSHYANAKQNGEGQSINGIVFKAPDLKPYEVVYNALLKTKKKISSVPGYHAQVRPYLQAFSAPWLGSGYWKRYGTSDIKAQIKAVKDAGYKGWIFWDPSNRYTVEQFK